MSISVIQWQRRRSRRQEIFDALAFVVIGFVAHCRVLIKNASASFSWSSVWLCLYSSRLVSDRFDMALGIVGLRLSFCKLFLVRIPKELNKGDGTTNSKFCMSLFQAFVICAFPMTTSVGISYRGHI